MTARPKTWLRRDISVLGLGEVFYWFLFIVMTAAAIGFGGPDRVRYAFGAGIGAFGVWACRSLQKQRALPVEQRRARRPRKVYTARKRRAAAVIVVMFVYYAIRPDLNASLLVGIAYALVFCGLILVVLNVRKQHFVRTVRYLTGRLGSTDTDAFGRSSRDG